MIEKIKTFFVYIFLILSIIWIVFFIFYFIPPFCAVWNSDEANGLPLKYDSRINTWVPDQESSLWPDHQPY